ncbi:hypothetical protein JQ615_17190 [Bradyrhizobium jicamae]|uniref:Uncharacterized protein n=1 Tax=Bradyrhizobium jicamae TaxID=280332 RepID=A0ABS5FK13_9BRAD|nr:Ig-like domain-containing protein [Bradyrhizobium jicamae]MBR0797129.1 hypothetical protein [Bradyrhizobium jicamae]MBR0934957.1 hypothetical protein [Bradyrhizobium jicamae]
MYRFFIHGLIGGLLTASASAPANATPNCMRDIKPYRLAGDTMDWSMTIAPGADCIQGLRWSTMQIFNVSVVDKPKSGELVLVGPGFRYFAKPGFTGSDSFTLVVVGKNRRDPGSSTLQIKVSGAAEIKVSRAGNTVADNSGSITSQ